MNAAPSAPSPVTSLPKPLNLHVSPNCAGTVVLDDFKLTGSLNQLTNPGFELEDAQDDSMGWGFAIGGGHAEVVTDAAMAHGGENYLSIGVTDNWAVAYNEDIVPAQFGETWRFSGFGK